MHDVVDHVVVVVVINVMHVMMPIVAVVHIVVHRRRRWRHAVGLLGDGWRGRSRHHGLRRWRRWRA